MYSVSSTLWDIQWKFNRQFIDLSIDINNLFNEKSVERFIYRHSNTISCYAILQLLFNKSIMQTSIYVQSKSNGNRDHLRNYRRIHTVTIYATSI